jgi:hypothetical protein
MGMSLFFLFLFQGKTIKRKRLNSEIQIPNPKQIPILNDQNICLEF